MSLTKPQLIFIGIAGFIIVLFGLIFAGVIPGLRGGGGDGKQTIKAELQFWGLYDGASAFSKTFSNISKNFPDVKINYRSFSDRETYEEALLEALAAGAGPDIFVIGNADLPRQINKITPIPQTKLSVLQLRSLFPRVVELDFVNGGNIFALPLSMDTLALYYNRDLLAQAGIPTPPDTWEEFVEMIPKLVKTDAGGNLTQAGAAIGTAKNIGNSADILTLLLLQRGARMISADAKSAAFGGKEGGETLKFYTQFADPRNKFYTWNGSLPDYLDAFGEELVAMIFDYADALPKIKAKNPFLPFAVSEMPYPEKQTKRFSYARYLGYAVSRQSRYADLAWSIILEMTTNRENVTSYLEAANRPPALSTLAPQVVNDLELGPFAKQALTAESWRPQLDPDGIKDVLNGAIEAVVSGREIADKAIRGAAEKVTQLMVKRNQ